jgi:hypothetical protein
MTYQIDAYVELGSKDNRMWLARAPCLDFSEARQRAISLVVGHRYMEIGPVIVLVIENRSGRAVYRIQRDANGKIGSYVLNR